MPGSFYQWLSRCNETFLAPLIARFTIQSHFSTMSTCSMLRTPRTISSAYYIGCRGSVHVQAVLWASVSHFCEGLGLSMHLFLQVFVDSSLWLIIGLIHCQYCKTNSKWSPLTFCKRVSLEFNGGNGHRIANAWTMISLLISWLLPTEANIILVCFPAPSSSPYANWHQEQNTMQAATVGC